MTTTLTPHAKRSEHGGASPSDDPAVGAPSAQVVSGGAKTLTAIIVGGPVVALGVSVLLLWGELLSTRDVVIGAALYFVSGFGISVGYHRCFTHRSFRPNRPLKILLAAAGSMAVEGSLIGWVAAHRRHHRFSDREGDPHSPHLHGPGLRARLRGFAHAHVGWLFTDPGTPGEHEAGDLRADGDLVWISRHWALFAVGSLVLPFVLGLLISGTLLGALTTFLWAGVVRMSLLHHVTWSVNSICHTFGRRPFRTRDRSSNVALLAVPSMGESFHNFHHAYPASARHGALPHQVDSAAALIRFFERAGWATDVNWPPPARISKLRVETTETQQPPV